MAARLSELPALDGGAVARAMFTLYAERQGKQRWGDKTPKYSLHMTDLEQALPEARFIHLIRDGRDVALSRARMVEGRGDPPPPPTRVARRWKRRIHEAREMSRDVTHYMELRYEDLVTDTEPSLRRVAEFIELDWDPAMLDYHAMRVSAWRRCSGRCPQRSRGAGRCPPTGA